MHRLPADVADVLASPLREERSRLVVRWPDGTTRRTFELTTSNVLEGSSVDADRTRDVRRSARLLLTDTLGTLAPTSSDSLLADGSRIAVARGPIVGGSPVYVPLMEGFVTGCEVVSRGVITLALESFLSAAAQPAGSPMLLPAGTYIGAALRTLLDPVLPFVEWVVDDRDRTLGSDIPVLPADDRLLVAMTITRANGLEVFDDRLGRIVVRPIPDPTTAEVVRTFAAPLSLTRRISRRPYNAVLVEASPGTGAPFSVLVVVDDPASPIHPDRIGLRVAPVLRSDTIADPDTATAAGRAYLAELGHAQDSVTAEEIPVLDIDEGDVCAWAEVRSGAVGSYRLDRISVPVVRGSTTIGATRVVPLWLP